jgi:AcrR family transcriptional regulator
MPRRAPTTERPNRKQAILMTAARLFARHGFHAVPLRQIADEAGVQLALVNYYFGQKHELFEAIFAHWADTIQQRLAGLHEAMALPQSQRLPAVVAAFVEPVLRLRATPEGEYYALLVARELHFEREDTERVLRTYFEPLAESFIDALQALLPHANRTQVVWCYEFMLGALQMSLSDPRLDRLSRGQARRDDPQAARLLAEFIVGGVRAALPAPRVSSTQRAPGSPKR